MSDSLLINDDGSPRDRAALSRAFGFPVPEPFVRVVADVVRCANDAGDAELDEFFRTAFGVFPADESRRYQQTPPELFRFGDVGCDGACTGYVIHASEFAVDDYPVGKFCPMDSDGVIFAGRDTMHAFELMLSGQLRYQAWDSDREEMPEETAIIPAVAERLGLHPVAEKTPYGPDGNGLPIVPNVPDGWLHVPSADGIGVLAPREAFEPAGATVNHITDLPVDQIVARARGAIEAGHPATALHLLREAYWNRWTETGAAEALVPALIESYRALRRPTLAAAVQERARWRFIL